MDALYAVYEASTLELWSFMMYNAIDGTEALLAVLFYFALVLFIVIILQVRYYMYVYTLMSFIWTVSVNV